MYRWLEVRTTLHVHVAIHPEDKRLSAHPRLLEDSPEALEWDSATLLESVEVQGRMQASDMGSEARDVGFATAQDRLEPEIKPNRDQILSQTLNVFTAPSATVHFEFAGKKGFLRLLGHECQPSADCDTTPFRRRGSWLLMATAIAVVGAYLLQDAFVSRHPFYAVASGSEYVPLTTIGFALGVFLMVAAWLRRRQVDGRKIPSRWHDKLGLPLGAACILAYSGLFLAIQPSATDILELISTGDMEMAELHAEALQVQGETSTEFLEARNALVQTRIRQLDNRAAVAFVERLLASSTATESLEAERRRLREEWIVAALARDDETSVESELTVLIREGAPPELVDGLRGQLENQRVTAAKDRLNRGETEGAVALLERIQAPHLAAENPAPLLMQAYLEQARRCDTRDLVCRATALKRAAAANPSDEAKGAMAAFRSAELKHLQSAMRTTGALRAKLNALQIAEADANALLGILENDSELMFIRGALLTNREGLVKGRLPFGEHIEVAAHLVGPSSLKAYKPGIWRLSEVPTGMMAFFFVEKDVARGLYITLVAHERDGISTQELQSLVEKLTGHEFTEKTLERSRSGVAHAKAKLGKYPALLGWDGSRLVEVSIGKVNP